jgi:hypothetical protein
MVLAISITPWRAGLTQRKQHSIIVLGQYILSVTAGEEK